MRVSFFNYRKRPFPPKFNNNFKPKKSEKIKRPPIKIKTRLLYEDENRTFMNLGDAIYLNCLNYLKKKLYIPLLSLTF